MSEQLLRLQGLRWKQLIETRGFTGGHLEWHQSAERRKQAARPLFSLAPPPATSLSSSNSVHFERMEIPYDEWLDQQMAAWRTRESEPDIVDSIGVADTVRLAKEWFSLIASDYFDFWVSSTSGDSEEFARWCREIVALIVTELGKLWESDQWYSEWFERACRQRMQDALVPLTKEWANRAQELEIQRLEEMRRDVRARLSANCDYVPRDGWAKLDDGLVIARDAQQVSPPKDALLDLLNMVLVKKALTVEGWAQGHRFGRTMVFDWKAARSKGKAAKGKVSRQKCTEIEQAIENDAAELGLHSD